MDLYSRRSISAIFTSSFNIGPRNFPPPFRKTLLDVNFLTGSVKSFILVSIKKMTSNSLQAMAVAKYLLLKKPLDPMLRQGPS